MSLARVIASHRLVPHDVLVGDLRAVFGANVRGHRNRAGLRQVDLADILHAHGSTISDIERGERSVTLEEQILICRALDVTLAELLRGANPDDIDALGL